MIREERRLELHDLHPDVEAQLEEVLAGLQAPVKQLPSKLFYDGRGSELFDRICELVEYYPTRTELAIMRADCGEMAAVIGARSLVIELGSGNGLKTRVLLEHLDEPRSYIPVDISKEHLLAAAHELARLFPRLEILPVCGDYTLELELPTPERRPDRHVVYFPGSTIGNFDPDRAVRFLKRMAAHAGTNGGLLIGIDLKKDPSVLHDAYNDSKGVTADFNLNLLRRLNRELGSDFDLDAFRHRAFYNEAEGRIEMHLVSRVDQQVRLGGTTISFAAGETIWTESSYKYDPEEFAALAETAGFRLERRWMDDRRWFAVLFLSVAG
jgi:dimethylhistidine N-methyltransferase